MAEFVLIAELLKLSESKEWDSAKDEWYLTDVQRSEIPQTCLCSHFPINEICTIKNHVTGHTTEVGNCCVKKFNNESDPIFRSVARVRDAIGTPSLSEKTIVFAFDRGWISEWEYNFYLDIMRKRNLSEKQEAVKGRINDKVVAQVDKKR